MRQEEKRQRDSSKPRSGLKAPDQQALHAAEDAGRREPKLSRVGLVSL